MEPRRCDTGPANRQAKGPSGRARLVQIVVVAAATVVLGVTPGMTQRSPGMTRGQQGDAVIALLAGRDSYRSQLDELLDLTRTYPAHAGWAICVIEERRCDFVPLGTRRSSTLPEQARDVIRAVAQRQRQEQQQQQGPRPSPAVVPTVEDLRLTVADEVVRYFERYWRSARADPAVPIEPADRALRLIVVADDLAIPRPGGRELRVREAKLTEGCYGTGVDSVRVADLPAEADIALHLVVSGGNGRPATAFPPDAVTVIARVLGDDTERPGRGDRHRFSVMQSPSECSGVATAAKGSATAPDSECRAPRVSPAGSPQIGPSLNCSARRPAGQAGLPGGPPSAPTPAPAPPPVATLQPPQGTPAPVVPRPASPGAGVGPGVTPATPMTPPPRPSPRPVPPEAVSPEVRPSQRDRPGPDPASVTRLAEVTPVLGAATIVEGDLSAGAGAITIALSLGPGTAGEVHVFGPGYRGTPAVSRRDAEVLVRSQTRVELGANAQAGEWRVFLRPMASGDRCPAGLSFNGEVTVRGARLAAGREFRFAAQAFGCSAQGPLMPIGSFEVLR